MSATEPLTITEELTLLALRRHDGKPMLTNPERDPALAGAIPADLWIADRVELVDGVIVVHDQLIGNPIVDQALNQIASEQRPHKPEWWVRKLQSPHHWLQTVQALTERGVITRKTKKRFGFLLVSRYPEVDAGPEDDIQSRIRNSLDNVRSDERTNALIALAYVSGLLAKTLANTDRELTKRVFFGEDKQRVKKISEDTWAGQAVRTSLSKSYNYATIGT